MKGLTVKEVEQLLDEYGLNEITEQKRKSIFMKFLEQFNNFLVILLIFAAVLSFFVGETVDGALIVGIVFLNALFGLYQEGKAEQAINLLKKMTVTKVRVIREGREQEIDSRYLVPGDIIFIEEGLKIPADATVFEVRNLEINEAALTGESLPVVKKIKDSIFTGTIVAKGRGYAKISATGMRTKFGQIAEHIELIKDTKTPLQKKLDSLTKAIGIGGILLSLIVFALNLFQGAGHFSAFLLAISLAVAIVPEGLPAVMTITLAIGVKEMAKRKAIIRKLAAIEALGSVTLIATDKTGTLTTNKMKVKEIYVDEKIYEQDVPPSLSNHPFSKMILNGILCSTASLVFIHDHNSYDVLGDPTEGALLYLGQKMGLIPEMVRKEWQIIDEQPFDSVTKRMSVLVSQKSIPSTRDKSQKLLFSKGAPESILEICSSILIGEKAQDLTASKVRVIEDTMEKWARKGLRVLAFAYKSLKLEDGGEKLDNDVGNEKKNPISHLKNPASNLSLLTSNMIFLGMVAIHDPPRPEVLSALAKTKQAGIKTVMITGDNEITAEAIGVSTGFIKEGDEILTGKQLDQYSDEELMKKLARVKVFARTTPFHKSRIVELYQKMGEIVAVTGDGINDAVALKQADVGVAMGLVGTDVARETADMVITDDNFATIVNAIEEGRNIIKNLKNAVKYLLSCNVSEAFSLIIGLMLGIPNLFFAIQLLYINLITDGVPALALAFSPREEHVMRRPPQKELELLTSFGRKYILAIGLLATFIVLSSYFIFKDGEAFRRTAAFSVLALIQSFIFVDLWISHQSVRKHFKKMLSGIFFLAFFIPFVSQYLIVKIPILSSIFKVETVSLYYYLAFVLASSLVLVGTKSMRRFLGH